MSTDQPIYEEVWRPVHGYRSYEVSSHGRVRSLKRKQARFLKLQLNKRSKYYQVHFSSKGTESTHGVHRLVARAFIGPITSADMVNHKDRCRSNNRVENLDVVCADGNAAHRMIGGWIQTLVRVELRGALQTELKALIRDELKAIREQLAAER